MQQTEIEPRSVTRQMPLYKVLIHNDPITSFHLVVMLLVQVFNKPFETACQIAMETHERDIGLVGIYSLEHAEFLVDQATGKARTEKSPLTFSIEPA